MNSTKFKVEDKFGDIFSKDSISEEQLTKLNNFFNQNIVNITFCITIRLFKPRKEKTKTIEPFALAHYHFQ